jgi:hypothetical protein
MMAPMAVEFPQRQIGALQEVAVRLLDSRKTGTDLSHLARDVLAGLYDVCAQHGLDRVSDELQTGDEDTQVRVLAERLATADLDGGGPRNTRPKQIADCVVAALELTVVEEPDRSVSLGDDVRAAVVAAIAGVVDAEVAPPVLREAIITNARARLEERFHPAFGKVVAQLDDRGQQLMKTPKVPLDALQAIQHALAEARNAVIGRIVGAAIDRAMPLIAAGDADAAARIDRPITVRSTPREVAILRACDARVAKSPPFIARSLFASLTDLVPIAWRAPAEKLIPYAASKTFAVGDMIDHPKFGRGKVIAAAQRIDVEFADGKHTLVHAPPRR